jgi:hypothetical protein
MGVPFAPIKMLHLALEAREGLDLKDRGEAHITVVTPPEYARLRSKIKMNEIGQIAAQMGMQSLPFETVCVGRGRKQEGSATLATYYVIVRAPGLVNLRTEIANRFRQRGGAVNAFVPDHFYSHVTVGYTKRDLHEEEGVIKDESSCLAPVVEQP